MAKKGVFTAEIEALSTILEAMDGLDEGQQSFVYQTVGDRLGLSSRKRRSAGGSGSNGNEHEDADEQDDDDELTPKQFMRDKKPKIDAERVACLAYYLNHYRKEEKFKTKELTLLNTEAAQPKLTNMSQTAKNATTQNKYLAQAGSGQKMITTLGEDVVRALPNHEDVKNVLANSHRRKTRKKRATKKKRAKKKT